MLEIKNRNDKEELKRLEILINFSEKF